MKRRQKADSRASEEKTEGRAIEPVKRRQKTEDRRQTAEPVKRRQKTEGRQQSQ